MGTKLRIRAVLAIALIAFWVHVLRGQTTPDHPTGAARIGTINLNAAIAGTRDGRTANSAMQAKFLPQRKRIEDEQKEMDRISGELGKPKSALGADQRNAMERTLEDRQKKLNRDKQDYQEALKREQQDYLQQINPKLVKTLEKYARDRGYDVVLDVSRRGGPVIYSEPACDITAEVIAAYDSR